MIGNATIVIVRPTAGGLDRNNDPIPGVPTRIALPGAGCAPRSSTDMRDGGRDGAITGLTVYAPAGVDVRATDSVEVDGDLYEIDGVPGHWTSPLTGWAAGVEIPLRKATG